MMKESAVIPGLACRECRVRYPPVAAAETAEKCANVTAAVVVDVVVAIEKTVAVVVESERWA